MGQFDNAFNMLDELNYEFENGKKTIKEVYEDNLEDKFNVELEKYFTEPSNQELIGKYDDYISNSNERTVRLKSFLDDCVNMSEDKIFKEGDSLYMKKRHAKNLLDEAVKMFKYEEDNMLGGTYESKGGSYMQAYMNERSIGKNGENKESTMQGIKNKLQKINICESIASGDKANYTSNLKTPEELAEFRSLKQSKPKNSNKNKQMKDEDYRNIFEPVMEKLLKNPETVTESEAAFLLSGEFGFRPSTVTKINIGAVDVKKGTIDVYDDENKSKQLFQAKTSVVEPANIVAQQLLSGLRERALLVYKPDKDGNINLVNCCEQNLHQGFESLCKQYNVNLSSYEGKYKLLRHRFAQNIYNEVRREYHDSDDMTEVQKRAKALVETNYLMGHESKKLNTTMGYIKNLW